MSRFEVSIPDGLLEDIKRIRANNSVLMNLTARHDLLYAYEAIVINVLAAYEEQKEK
ncbi:MAG: hypothetical protein MJZ37_07770 [Bacilli bacterium]|nr:hypothetical protein [Bacilli bacterium]